MAAVAVSNSRASDTIMDTGSLEGVSGGTGTGKSGMAEDAVAAVTTGGLQNVQRATQQTQWGNSRNLFLSIVDSAGFTLMVVNMIKALPFIGVASEQREWNEAYIMGEVHSRLCFFEVCVLSWGAAGWNLIATIHCLVWGLIGLLFGKTAALQEGLRTAIKIVANLFFAAIGLVGCFSPKHAYTFAFAVGKAFHDNLGGRIDYAEISTLFATKIAGFVVGAQGIAVAALGNDGANQNEWAQKVRNLVNLSQYAAMQREPHNLEHAKAFAKAAIAESILGFLPRVIHDPSQLQAVDTGASSTDASSTNLKANN